MRIQRFILLLVGTSLSTFNVYGCRQDQFRCGDGQCIDERRRCDRRYDCHDRSDETQCRCRQDQFRCGDGQCIDERRRCDRRYDCHDRSDETQCRCRQDQFRCGDGQCIDERRRCDRRYDCHDRSDETQCPRPLIVTVTPRELMLREGRQADFLCSVTGSSAVRLRWSRSGNLALPAKASSENGRLVIPDLQLRDSGEYVCSAFGVTGDYQAVARLHVRRIGPGNTPASVGRCGPGQFLCQNNECIPSDYRCDGDKDCSDGSDELYCTTDNLCEPNEFRCTSGLCVMKIWRCDGDNDCGDGSDEADCSTGRPGDLCRPDEYRCRSGDQCMPASYQCDGEIDCQDRSDEIGCSVPFIILAPVPRIDVEIGSQFTVICEAMGTPTPLIVWRFNWGNIPTGKRIYTSSINGRGNLTITNAIIEDSGAYTCEAMNTKGTIFASPDAIAIVRQPRQLYTCPRLPYPTFVYQASCYMFVNDYNTLDWYTWDTANDYCKEHNLELTSIHSSEESDFLTSHMINNNHYWIGLTRISRRNGMHVLTDRFAWTDGSTLNYTKWVNGIPPGPPSISDDPYYDLEEEAHCLALNPVGYFILEQCFDWVRPWICKMPAVLQL